MVVNPSSDKSWALITGASAGIGAEFARQLAASGFHLVLSARRHDRLAALAEELHRAHGTQTRVIVADLADPASPAAIAREIEAADLALEVLVNNAGYGVPGTLSSVPWSTHRDFLQVMVGAVVELTYRLLPILRRQEHSTVINVASVAGLVPGTAGHTLYGAAKAFLVRLSESLSLENEPFGVRVQALCPGFTHSEFHDVEGIREQVSRMPGYMWMQAEEVVRESLRGARRPGSWPVLVPGRVNRAIGRLVRWLPPRLTYRLVARQSRHFRATEPTRASG